MQCLIKYDDPLFSCTTNKFNHLFPLCKSYTFLINGKETLSYIFILERIHSLKWIFLLRLSFCVWPLYVSPTLFMSRTSDCPGFQSLGPWYWLSLVSVLLILLVLAFPFLTIIICVYFLSWGIVIQCCIFLFLSCVWKMTMF